MPRTRASVRALIAVALAVLLFVTGFGPAYAETSGDPTTGSLEITFGDVQPVGAAVTVRTPGYDRVAGGVVGSDGVLRMSGLTPGTYLLVMDVRADEAPGSPGNWYPGVLDSSAAGTISVVAGETSTARWDVPRGATVSGVVRDSRTHQPLTGIKVLVRESAGWGEYRNTTTDSEGRYVATGLTGGKYLVQYSQDAPSDYYLQTQDATVEPGTTADVDADLVWSNSITGTLSFAPWMTGPFTVELFKPDLTPVFSQTFTKADPTFRLSGLDAGEYLLRFSGGVHDVRTTWLGGTFTSAGSTHVVVTDGGSVHVTDTLAAPYTEPRTFLEGSVTGPDGEAVDDIRIDLWDQDGFVRVSDTTGSGGRFGFEFQDIPPGTYRIAAHDTGSGEGRALYDPAWYGGTNLATAKRITLGTDQTTRIHLALTRTIPAGTGTLTGRVTSGSAGLAGAQLWIEKYDPTRGESIVAAGYADSQGRYTVKGLKPDTYIVHVFDRPGWAWQIAPRYVGGATRPADASSITVAAGTTTTANADLGRTLTRSDVAVVRGRVTSAATGAGIPDVSVVAVGRYGVRENVWTDADGWYEYEKPDAWAGQVVVENAVGFATPSVARSASAALGSVAFADITLNRTMASTAPQLPATARVGVRATATVSGWTSGVQFSYQWRRDGAAISGATGTSYVPTAADRGKHLTLSVTGKRSGYATTTRTSAARTVASGILTSSSPKITGILRYGHIVTASPGTWTSGTTFTYQWYRNGVAITGAVYKSHKLTSGDVSRSMTVKVTGHKSGYTTLARLSAKTSRVAW